MNFAICVRRFLCVHAVKLRRIRKDNSCLSGMDTEETVLWLISYTLRLLKTQVPHLPVPCKTAV